MPDLSRGERTSGACWRSILDRHIEPASASLVPLLDWAGDVMATLHTIDAARQMRNVTLHVKITGQQELRVRTWVACQLIKLAALVLGTNLDIQQRRVDGRS